MSRENFIPDKPLPVSQDFEQLKNLALSYIEDRTGNRWTNFNAVDPGITILDQVCYALTELGYCNDFSIEDLLTNEDGRIEYTNQFYLPEQILTTSPLIIADYRKYLIDGVPGILNALIITASGTDSVTGSLYKVFLYINPAINIDSLQPGSESENSADQDESKQTNSKIQDICTEAFYYLNKSRNLGEWFPLPVALQSTSDRLSKVHYAIRGTIGIDTETDAYVILANLQWSIRNYIFPAVTPQPGWRLQDEEETCDGPRLQHGQIATSALGEKKDRLTLIQILSLIGSVVGIVSYDEIAFEQYPTETAQAASAGVVVINDAVQTDTEDALLDIDILRSVTNNLKIQSKGKDISLNLSKLRLAILSAGQNDERLLLADDEKNKSLPCGDYRNINEYYSIQNTFPEAFAVGINTVHHPSPEAGIAHSRQLQGYLTLFDQVIANQFSQLAGIGKLFSFQNQISGFIPNPETHDSVTDYKAKKHLYPVPNRSFAPTYFYQALYDVPYIHPILKRHRTFNFRDNSLHHLVESHKEWNEYKRDAYNPYMRGLMAIVEDEAAGLERRNNMLDHLLARHGESPVVIDEILSASQCFGGTRQDQVIFKSLYLQNLGLISYYRNKACNYAGAGKVSAILPSPDEKINLQADEDSIDSIFRTAKIDLEEAVSTKDIINYSTLEILLSLLFKLSPLYKKAIVSLGESGQLLREEAELTPELQISAENEKFIQEKVSAMQSQMQLEQQVLLWLNKERKKHLLIENRLLFRDASFTVVFKNNTEKESRYYRTNKLLSYTDIIGFSTNPGSCTITDQPGIYTCVISNTSYTLVDTDAPTGNQAFTTLGTSSSAGWSFAIALATESQASVIDEALLYQNRVELFFPSFVPQLNTPEFLYSLNVFMQAYLPVHLLCSYHFIDSDAWQALIPLFANWHNGLIFQDPLVAGTTALPGITNSATELLIHLYAASHE